jgi:hypothetical protein
MTATFRAHPNEPIPQIRIGYEADTPLPWRATVSVAGRTVVSWTRTKREARREAIRLAREMCR